LGEEENQRLKIKKQNDKAKIKNGLGLRMWGQLLEWWGSFSFEFLVFSFELAGDC
jgi:hypothetical protein